MVQGYQLLFSRKDHPSLINLIRGVTLNHQLVRTASGMVGPLGIAKMMGEAVQQSLARVVLLMASLSVSLGLFNLIPLGVLDGGKALQSIIQIIFGSNTSATGMMIYQALSLAILLTLMVGALFGDVWNIFRKKK